MRELLKARGLKITPQRELILGSFFELGKHVSVDELYRQVARKDSSVGYSTVWRNLKLICRVGLAEEVNIGDGVTRYDRVTGVPHGHLYCHRCKKFIEFDTKDIMAELEVITARNKFKADGFKIEVQGLCRECLRKAKGHKKQSKTRRNSAARN